MSLYPHHYGQPYPAPSFAPSNPPSGYQYHHPVPPPPPVYHVDPATFRRDYANRLAELTLNSRPIIQNLSMLAQEYSRFAEIVAKCLENHIRMVPPWMKLPAFYLLDAISKNVYDPYAGHFAAFVIPLYLETYNQVDQNTRSKMEEMLLTWRHGSPTGRELFGVSPQVAIERGVWGDGGSTNNSSTFYTGSGQITKAQVLSELEFTQGQKERAVQANPYDSVSQNHINVLHQLRKLIEAGVSQQELQQILNQLRALVRSAPPPPLPPVPAPQSWPAQSSFPSYNTMPPPQPQHASHPTFNDIKQENLNMSSLHASTSTSTESGPASLAAGDISSLLSTLFKNGVVSGSGTPLGAGSSARDEENKAPAVDQERLASRNYRKLILSQNIKLTSTDIAKKKSNIINLLYGQLPAQCKQCGIRFADNSIGKKRMDGHLDMHFRQNRKANQGIGRGHSRSWFIGVEDWISDVSVDVKGKGTTDSSRPLNSKAAAAAEIAKREADLRARYVVVPPGDEAKLVSCPICKETFKSEFLEEDEDWVWKNAVVKEDRVYHATCHAEAVASTNSLAARLRTEMAYSSRSGTPEVQSSTVLRSTPPRNVASTLKTEVRKSPSPASQLAGTKRKVEIEYPLNGETDSSPPLKKSALSTTT